MWLAVISGSPDDVSMGSLTESGLHPEENVGLLLASSSFWLGCSSSRQGYWVSRGLWGPTFGGPCWRWYLVPGLPGSHCKSEVGVWSSNPNTNTSQRPLYASGF